MPRLILFVLCIGCVLHVCAGGTVFTGSDDFMEAFKNHKRDGVVFLDSAKLKFDLYESDFYDADFKKVRQLNLSNDSIQGIYFVPDRIDTGNGKFLAISFSNVSGRTLFVSANKLDLNIQHSQLDTLIISGCNIISLLITDSRINHILFPESTGSSFYIGGNVTGREVNVSNFVLGPGDHLNTLSVTNSPNKPLLVMDYNTRFKYMDIDLKNFTLALDTTCTDCNNANNYQTFFNREQQEFDKNMQTDNYRELYYFYRKWQVAKENKLTQMCNYDIPKNFYGFGLEKKLIIRSVAILFGISFLIFIVFQKKILSSYDFELNRVELLKHKGANDILGILIATTLVFFGVKLDYKKMHFTSVVGLILLLAIFTTGIICYGFLANFILTVK